jgi:hypothetical protein
MLNQNEIKNNWSRIKPQILGHWNKVTDAELEKTRGSVVEMDKLIASKYGASSQKSFEQDLEKICNSFTTARPAQERNEREVKVTGEKFQAAPDEYQSPQNPKRETQTPKMDSRPSSKN